MTHIRDLSFLLYYPEGTYKCRTCSTIFSNRNASQTDHWFLVDTFQCDKCNQLALIHCYSNFSSSHPYPYRPIYDYFYKKVMRTQEYKAFFEGNNIDLNQDSQDYIERHLDYKKFSETIERMIEPCKCGGIFRLEKSTCPKCDLFILDCERVELEAKKAEFCLAPIRPLEDIPKLKSLLLQEIFKDVAYPKTKKEVDDLLENFSKDAVLQDALKSKK